MTSTQNNLPDFLSDYGSFYSHMQSMLDNMENTEKGQRFAEFARDLVPHTEIGKLFNTPELRQPSHDGGVDLEANAKEGLGCLYIQSRYTIRSANDLNAIIGKFKAFEDKKYKKETVKQLDIFLSDSSTDTDSDREQIHYMIFTASKVIGTHKLTTYEKSTDLSLPFYQSLKDSHRLHILDGPKIVPVSQNSYRKKHFIPSDIKIEFVSPFILMGNVYIGVISGFMLKKLYEKYGDSLFLENIREWLGPHTGQQKKLGRETVNEAISATLDKEPKKFLSRNNGITFRASTVKKLSDSSLHLVEASIVNGCQTTMAIVKMDEPISDCQVLIKIVETDDAWDIAGSANFQTEVNRIDIDLARYIRSEVISLAADKYGMRLSKPENIPESIFSVFSAISQATVIESEIRSTFIGLFSRTPQNVIASNYTELRYDLLNEYNTDVNKDEILYRLFILNIYTQEAAKRLRGKKKDIVEIFKRIWDDNTKLAPRYKALLTILAASGLVGENIYKKKPTYHDLCNFLEKASNYAKNDTEKYIEIFEKAFASLVVNVYDPAKDQKENMQVMYRHINGARFDGLYFILESMP